MRLFFPFSSITTSSALRQLLLPAAAPPPAPAPCPPSFVVLQLLQPLLLSKKTTNKNCNNGELWYQRGIRCCVECPCPRSDLGPLLLMLFFSPFDLSPHLLLSLVMMASMSNHEIWALTFSAVGILH